MGSLALAARLLPVVQRLYNIDSRSYFAHFKFLVVNLI